MLGECAQTLGLRIAAGVGLQIFVVAPIAVDNLENLLFATLAGGRRKQAFYVEDIGVQEQMHHRLKIVGIHAADIGRDEGAVAMAGKRAAAGYICSIGFFHFKVSL